MNVVMIMTLTQATYKRIENLCDEYNLTINGLCTLAGVAQSTVYNLASNKTTNPGSLLILRICRALKITLSDFYDDTIFLTLDDE